MPYAYDIFFYEAFSEEAATIRAQLPKTVRAGFAAETIQEQQHEHCPAPIISVRTQSRIPNSWSTQLNAIITRSTGYDHILRYRQACGVEVAACHLPLYCHRAVAEQAMTLWMMLLRRIPQQLLQFSTFNRSGLTGRECAAKTLLVVGVGNIGYQVVDIGRGLQMKVLGVDIEQRHPDVDYVSIEDGLAVADIVVCAMNLTNDNDGYFDKARWQQLKPGGLFINISRGELALPQHLLKALANQQLTGIALDVYADESTLGNTLRAGQHSKSDDPLVAAHRQLHAHPQVICTPHNAFNTSEALQRKAQQSVDQYHYFLQHGHFEWDI